MGESRVVRRRTTTARSANASTTPQVRPSARTPTPLQQAIDKEPVARTAPAASPSSTPECDTRSDPSRLTAIDYVLVVILTVAALFTRLYRLGEPRAVVFDEYHFGKFINGYFTGHYFFDIHPPLGKLLLAFAARLSGIYKPTFGYHHIHEPYPDSGFLAPRTAAALFGSAVIPTLYLVVRAMRLSAPAALCAAVLLLGDHMLLCESRLILVDSQLVFFTTLALLFALKLWDAKPGTARRKVFLVATAVAGSAGISIKWTAAVTPLLIAIVSFFGVVFTKKTLSYTECAAAAAIALAFYMATYLVHFWLLPLSGDGDAFMSMEFQRKLIGSRFFDAKAKPLGFISKFIELNKQMYISNRDITTRHNWESKWYEWPFDLRGISYYVRHSSPKVLQYVYLIVNPATAYICLAALLVGLFPILYLIDDAVRMKPESDGHAIPAKLKARKKQHQQSFQESTDAVGESNSAGAKAVSMFASVGFRGRILAASTKCLFCFGGYILNLLPYIGVKRCTFLYHYLPALVYATILLAVIIDLIPPIRYKDVLLRRWSWILENTQAFICIILIVPVSWAFFNWAPWVYAIDITVNRLEEMRLFPRWN